MGDMNHIRKTFKEISRAIEKKIPENITQHTSIKMSGINYEIKMMKKRARRRKNISGGGR